jgi:hypothetical protein
MLSVKAQAELAHSKESVVLEQDKYYPGAGYSIQCGWGRGLCWIEPSALDLFGLAK